MGESRVRTRARVEGTVQGVGFRPFVYRLASDEGLAGYVLNDDRGVLLEVEGPPESVRRFVARLSADAPPLAAVERVVCDPLAPRGQREFRILESRRTGAADALVSADSSTCSDCLTELSDPRDRRYRYPFINCTNCGPRFTIVRGVPYDRPLTTMAGFQMCEQCAGEYEDPLHRRFHAQPNACPRCGPSVRVVACRRGRAAACRFGRRDRVGRGSPRRRSDRRGQGPGRLSPRMRRRRRAGGGRPARPQAPRGQAVRADGG